MRVAFVCAHYAPMIGGVEKHVLEIAGALANHGCEVDVVTHEESKLGLASVEELDGVTVRRFPMLISSKNYAFSTRMRAYLQQAGERYDVVHAHGYHALPALIAASVNPNALVFTPHYHGTGHSPFRKLLHPPYRRLGKVIFDRAKRVIAVSPPEARLIERHFPAVASKLQVIPNGVDRKALAAAEPFQTDRTIVLSAGRLESYKHVEKTIAAFGHLDDSFALRVTGDGPAKAALEEQVQTLGLGERAQLMGKVSQDDLYRWFATASVYVSLSSNEAMPVALIECLAAGARVVASDIPAHQDLLAKTQGNIALVPLDASIEQVALAIRQQAAASAGTPQIDSWEEVAQLTLATYREALGQDAQMANHTA